MVLGSRRVNIIWKSFQNYLGFILELLEIDLESFFKQKVNILNMFLYISSGNEEKMKSQLQISSSGNESRPGTHFKMCSRSRQYQRFEYHQKLLTWKRSYAISKSTYLIFVTSRFDTNCHECRERIPREYSSGIHGSWCRTEKAQKSDMSILKWHNSSSMSLTFDDIAIFDNVMTWSTF